MRNRNDKLDRLNIAAPCPADWNSMVGTGAVRHCAQCDCSVHDLVLLTPREVDRLIESRNGRLCARITRDGAGRIITRLPLAAAANERVRRPSALAAALMAGLLGVPGTLPAAATEARMSDGAESEPGVQPQPTKAAPPGGASLFGRLSNETGEALGGVTISARNTLDDSVTASRTAVDGRYVFVGLASGVYELTASAPGRSVEKQGDLILNSGERREVNLEATRRFTISTGGAMVVSASPLREVLAESLLVVVAVAGPTQVVKAADDDSWAELRTELFVTATLKGDLPAEVVVIDRFASFAPEDADPLAPGTLLLAFLEPGETAGIWRSTDRGFGLKTLEEAPLAAYRERIEALTALSPSDENYAAELLEWMVATVENPLTREATLGELSWATWQLDHLAAERGTTTEHAAEDLIGVTTRFLNEGGTLPAAPRHDLLAALLTDAHRARLTRALVESHGDLEDGGLALFGLVDRWAPEKAIAWLAREARSTRFRSPYSEFGILSMLAARLPGAHLQALVAEFRNSETDEQQADVVDRLRRALDDPR